MPDIRKLAQEIQAKQKKPFVKGIRPDHLTRLQPNDISNQTQSEHKLDTNRTQSGYKTVHKVNTNSTQTKHKKIETVHKVDTQPDTNFDTNSTQTEHKLNTNTSFAHLIGLQREMLIFIYRSCVKERSQVTEQLSLEYISESLKIPIGSVKTTISRLIEKEFLKRISFKNGRGGWSQYLIFDAAFKELFQYETEHKLDTNRTQSRHKMGSKLNTQPNTSLSSSSSYLLLENNKTTTTSEPQEPDKNSFPSDWLEIDTSCLESIGFTQTHLKQLYSRKYCSAEQAQDSIYHYAFYLEHTTKKPASPIGYFMSVMKSSGYFSRPDGYQSRRELAEIQRVKELEKEYQERKERQQRILELKFEEWWDALSEVELKKYVTLFNITISRPSLQKNVLKDYFFEQCAKILQTNPDIQVGELQLKSFDAPNGQNQKLSEENDSENIGTQLTEDVKSLDEKAQGLLRNIQSLEKMKRTPGDPNDQALQTLKDKLLEIEAEQKKKEMQIRDLVNQQFRQNVETEGSRL